MRIQEHVYISIKTKLFCPGRLRIGELSKSLKEKQGILLGFKDSMPAALPEDIQLLQFAALQEGEVLN